MLDTLKNIAVTYAASEGGGAILRYLNSRMLDSTICGSTDPEQAYFQAANIWPVWEFFSEAFRAAGSEFDEAAENSAGLGKCLLCYAGGFIESLAWDTLESLSMQIGRELTIVKSPQLSLPEKFIYSGIDLMLNNTTPILIGIAGLKLISPK